MLTLLGCCAVLVPFLLIPLLIADHWMYTSSLPVINASRVRDRVGPPLLPYRRQDCAWAAPSTKAFDRGRGSPRIAVCLAGAFRTITSRQVYSNIARHIESLSPNTHTFAVGQLGDEKGTGPHILGQKARLSEDALWPAWQRLQPVCVRYSEEQPPCQESSCTGQWNKVTACARMAQAYAQQRGIEYDLLVKLRFDMMFPQDYPTLKVIVFAGRPLAHTRPASVSSPLSNGHSRNCHTCHLRTWALCQ